MFSKQEVAVISSSLAHSPCECIFECVIYDCINIFGGRRLDCFTCVCVCVCVCACVCAYVFVLVFCTFGVCVCGMLYMHCMYCICGLCTCMWVVYVVCMGLCCLPNQCWVWVKLNLNWIYRWLSNFIETVLFRTTINNGRFTLLVCTQNSTHTIEVWAVVRIFVAITNTLLHAYSCLP